MQKLLQKLGIRKKYRCPNQFLIRSRAHFDLLWHFSSFRRKPESSRAAYFLLPWFPACAGMKGCPHQSEIRPHASGSLRPSQIPRHKRIFHVLNLRLPAWRPDDRNDVKPDWHLPKTAKRNELLCHHQLTPLLFHGNKLIRLAKFFC